ncbi:DUF551 domain-containing protein [Variovorax sp. GT1P44]|uniref:DUF551 domain-containing protein n=1 Tax=Variovorax sp. GT1P44 TaxID=3443742 RepID=UPI003F46D64D
MTRDEIIALAQKCGAYVGQGVSFYTHQFEAFAAAISARASEAEDAWITVGGDRFPEPDVPVLATNGRTIGVYAFQNDGDGWAWAQQKWCWNLADPDGLEWDDDYEITHWRPLPKPPTGDAGSRGETNG